MQHDSITGGSAVPAHVAQTLHWLATPGNAAIAAQFGLVMTAAPAMGDSTGTGSAGSGPVEFTRPRTSLTALGGRLRLAALHAPSASEPSEGDLLAAQARQAAIAL